MAGRIHIGTSGWSYAHWKGVFYPSDVPSREWLSYYAERFDTVELNSSFYRTPPDASMRAWSDAAPRGFVFAVKANRFITHTKRLNDAQETVPRELDSARRLGRALGPVLFQLPPTMRRDDERLSAFLDALPGRGRFVVEFRHRSWDDTRVYDVLAEHHVAVCLHDWRRREWPRQPVEGAAGLVYVRFHGPDGAYGGRYERATLEAWAARCRDWRADGRDVYCYFNNDAKGNAVRDALALRELLGEARSGRQQRRAA